MENRVSLDVQDGLIVSKIGFLNTNSRWKGALHNHDDVWELVVPLSGRFWQIGSEITKEVSDHVLYLVPPGIPHCFVNADDQPASMFYVFFNFSYAPLVQQQEDIQQYIDQIPEMMILHHEFMQILEDIEQPSKDTLNQKRSYILLAMSMLVQYLYMYTDTNFKSITHQNKLIANVIMYLKKNMNRQVTISEVAKHFHLTPSYLGILFHEKEHIHIKQYHEQLRMAKALELLRLQDDKMNITNIAESLGYSTVQYFTRRFKQYYLLPPRQMISLAHSSE